MCPYFISVLWSEWMLKFLVMNVFFPMSVFRVISCFTYRSAHCLVSIHWSVLCQEDICLPLIIPFCLVTFFVWISYFYVSLSCLPFGAIAFSVFFLFDSMMLLTDLHHYDLWPIYCSTKVLVFQSETYCSSSFLSMCVFFPSAVSF